MPPSPLRSGLQAAGRSGLRGLALAALCIAVGPVLGRLLPASAAVAVFPVQAMLAALGLVALVHVLAATRPVPAPSVWPPDPSAGVALRRAASLRHTLLRLALLDLLVVIVAAMLTLPFAGDLLQDDAKLSVREEFEIGLPITLVAVLLQAFVALAPQRVALVGDPRVMLAVVHSARVARTSYAALFGITLMQSALLLGASAVDAYDAPEPISWALVALSVPVQLLGVAWLTEVFLAGPALVLPPGAAPPSADVDRVDE